MKTRAAILWQSHQPLTIENIDIPKLKSGQVLVKIFISGVCRAQYNEIIALKGPDKFLPHLLGHEASGIIVDAARGVTKVKQGDYVCLSWIKGRGGDGINSQYKCGSRTINAGAVTTFSDYAVVSENRVNKIPRHIPHDIAAVLGCAVSTGCGIVRNRLKAGQGQSIAVFGTGGIGLCVVMGAKLQGCGSIIAVDISADKLKIARQLGATHVFKADTPRLVERIVKLMNGGCDFAVDASGVQQAMENAFDVVKAPGGVCVIAGNLSAAQKIAIHPFDLIKGKQIAGTWGGETNPDRDIPHYGRLFMQGKLPVDQMITHRLPLEQVNQAFDLMQQGQTGRVVLVMNNS